MQSCFQGISPISLRRVLPEAEIFGADDFVMLNCVTDIEKLRPHDVFFAIRERDTAAGPGADTHQQIPEALNRGAGAVVSEDMTENPFLMNPDGKLVPLFLVKNSKSAYSRACQALYRFPGKSLNMIGITGTMGKTMTSYLVAAILGMAGNGVGMIGSIGCFDGLDASANPIPNLPPKRTSSWLSRMYQNDCSNAVVEISSQALALSRLDGMSFETVCLTNLLSAHLDYHGSIESYRRAKMRIFEYLTPDGMAVLNADDPLVSDVTNWLDIPVLTYGIHASADVSATVLEQFPSEQTILLTAGTETLPMRTAIVGNHHIYNCLAAATIGLRLGIDLTTIVRGIESVDFIPGRMERIECGQPFRVYVDAARTPEELKSTLQFLREVTPGKVHLVLGTCGNSSPQQRPALGNTAARYADFVTLSDGNPGTVLPSDLMNDVLRGVQSRFLSRVTVCHRRQAAIVQTLETARPGDTVLIAGRGCRR